MLRGQSIHPIPDAQAVRAPTMASAAFAEALKRPDVVKVQFDLLYASLLGEEEDEEERSLQDDGALALGSGSDEELADT